MADNSATPEMSCSRQSIFRRGNRSAVSIQRTPVTVNSVTFREDDRSSSSTESYYKLHKDDDETGEEAIRRYLDVGDLSSAAYWIDRCFAKDCEEEAQPSPLRLAEYLKSLTMISEWIRVCGIIENRHLLQRHIVFAHYYVNALFHRKMYSELLQLPVAGLFDEKYKEILPLRAPPDAGSDSDDFYLQIGGSMRAFTDEEFDELDKVAVTNKVYASTLLVFGRSYLIMENRDAASKCLIMTLANDPKCLIAEHLMSKYNLVTDEHASLYAGIMEHKTTEVVPKLDPRSRTQEAMNAYQRGDALETKRITEAILNEHGLYMDCLALHVNALVQLEDADALFLLAHKLVDAIPNNEISWYAVALYYYICGSNQAAKNFMNKATMMNASFGEGWLAFGHILASENENEQALNCYYRASRILERHYEPLLYVAIQYNRSGVDLSEQFLRDAAALAPNNAIICHEQGTLAYNSGKYEDAERLLREALRRAIGVDDVDTGDPTVISKYALNVFWEPLVNNLGHCARKLGKYQLAIEYHRKCLLMNSRSLSALSSVAMCYACTGDVTTAAEYFHRALAVDPYSATIRAALDKMIETDQMYQPKFAFVNSLPPVTSVDDLSNFLTAKVSADDEEGTMFTPEQVQAKEIAISMKRLRRDVNRTAAYQRRAPISPLIFDSPAVDSMDIA